MNRPGLELNKTHTGNALALAGQIPDNSISMIATSPPYFGLRNYSTAPIFWPEISFIPVAGLPEVAIPEQEASLGAEKDPWAYIGHLVAIFRELRRGLRRDGTLWLNLGDSYSAGGRGTGKHHQRKMGTKTAYAQDLGRKSPPPGLTEKNLLGIPWRAALALQADGWILRSEIIWHKINGMPASVKDRVTVAHEQIFLFSKSPHYYYDALAIAEPIKESSKARLGRGVGDHKNVNGAPGQTPHTMSQPRLNVKFGGDKANGYGTRTHSGKDWQPDEVAMANRRSVWSLSTQNYTGGHYAAWPEKLVELMILAGCPESTCPECGNPWVRVVEKKKGVPDSFNGSSFNRGKTYIAAVQSGGEVGKGERTIGVKTIGFQPTCQHNLDPVPGVALDPFMGSGTTGRVVIAHRRNYLGFELNQRYVEELVPDRLDGVQIRFG